MNDLLEMPALGRIPRAYTVYQLAPLSAKAALALMDTGYGKSAGEATLAAEVIERVLDGWLESFTWFTPPRGPRQPLASVFGKRRVCYQLRAEYTEDVDEEKFSIELKARKNVPAWRQIGKRLAQAEQLRGLGQTALTALAHASDAALPILLPETLVIMAGDRTHLNHRLKGFPKWVLNPEPLERQTVVHLANPRRTKFTGRLARAILRVEDAIAAARHTSPPAIAVGALTTYPLVVSWESGKQLWNTALTQITDDFRREQDEDTIFRFMLKPGEGVAEALQKFLASIAATAPILQAVDALVEILSGKETTDEE